MSMGEPVGVHSMEVDPKVPGRHAVSVPGGRGTGNRTATSPKSRHANEIGAGILDPHAAQGRLHPGQARITPAPKLSALAHLRRRLERDHLEAAGEGRLVPLGNVEFGTNRALNTSVSTTTGPRTCAIVGVSSGPHRGRPRPPPA